LNKYNSDSVSLLKCGSLKPTSIVYNQHILKGNSLKRDIQDIQQLYWDREDIKMTEKRLREGNEEMYSTALDGCDIWLDWLFIKSTFFGFISLCSVLLEHLRTFIMNGNETTIMFQTKKTKINPTVPTGCDI
jgi:hypothetical protein